MDTLRNSHIGAILLNRKAISAALAFVDAGSWVFATFAMVLARYDFLLTRTQWSTVFLYVAVTAATQIALGLALRIYGSRVPKGSFIDASSVAVVSGIAGLVGGLALTVLYPTFPRGIALLAPPTAVITMMAVRFAARAIKLWLTQKSLERSDRTRVLIYGAGNGGQQLGKLIFEDRDAPFHVVGFIDDDPAKRGRIFEFGSVIGSGEDLLDKVRETRAETVIVAVTNPEADFITRTAEILDQADIRMLLLPPVGELVSGRIRLGDVKPFDVTSLLGRKPITSDLSSVGQYLRGKRVLITGAGGSIGSEIARQVHALEPEELICLDRDESALHSVQLSIYGKGLLDTNDMVLCDIRDLGALRKVFADHRPQIVFHAAALKHLPMLEQYPDEGWKTNVLGSLNVLRASAEAGVERYVNISTDKAADPTSVLGKTKRRAEELTAWYAMDGARYVSVRFGNVLGSRGSVLHSFLHQIRKGGPVTVVDPEVTRYFMTIPEACQLVIQAGAIGQPGEVMVLEMGEPVKILDMAKQLIRSSGRPVEITYTGLREGEKLHEVLFSRSETSRPTSHPLIYGVPVDPFDPADLTPNYEGADFSGLRLDRQSPLPSTDAPAFGGVQ